MKKCLLSLLAAMSAICLYAYEPSIKDIDIRVTLSADGTAHIVEVWDVVVAKGTEWYLVRSNLGDIKIQNLAVHDESGTEYTNIGSWEVDRSLEWKTNKCGLNATGSGFEICWGVGSYGPHVFTVSYDFTNSVKSLNDYDMLHLQFISDELSSPPQHARLSLSAPVALGEDNSRIWAFGYNGTINWQDDGTVVAESTEAFDYESSMILLLRFDKGIFESQSVQDRDFEAVLKRAKEGSFYPDDEPEPWYYSLLGFLMFIGLGWLCVWRPIKSFLSGMGLGSSTDRKRIKDIFGVRKLPKEFEWSRDIPFDGDIFETYYVASHLKGTDSYPRTSRVPVTFFSADRSMRHKEWLTVAGPLSELTLSLPFQASFAIVDFDHDLSDACSDDTAVLVRKGVVDMPHAFCKVNVPEAPSTPSWIHVGLHFAHPDGDTVPGIVRMADRYWQVTGSVHCSATGRFLYNMGSNGSSGASNIDMGFFDRPYTLDSIWLLYRPDSHSPWQRASNSRTSSSSITTGYFTYRLLPGQYTLAVCDTDIIPLMHIDTPSDWGNLIGLAIMPTMVSLLTLAISTRYIGPTKTAVLGVFEPLTAILIGTLMYGEPLTPKMSVGIAICIAAVVFMILKPGSSRK